MSRQLVAWLALGTAGCIFGARDSDGDGISDNDEEAQGLDPAKMDTDGDGLNDGEEAASGADPLEADTDGDGLNDGDEIANGADPTEIDTDGDGYTDRDEVFEQHDPADADDVIYRGGWPYFYEKTEVKGGGLNRTIEVGKRFAQLEMKDQFGDVVNVFDFYNDTRPIVIDVSAQWCPPCNGLAAWLEGEEDPYYDQFWPAGPDVIARGEVVWITILGEQMDGSTATKRTATEWYNEYPSSVIPVLADTDYTSADYVGLQWWPTVLLLDPDLTVAFHDGSAESVLQQLALQFPE